MLSETGFRLRKPTESKYPILRNEPSFLPVRRCGDPSTMFFCASEEEHAVRMTIHWAENPIDSSTRLHEKFPDSDSR